MIACGEDAARDEVAIVTLSVSEQTGTYQPLEAPGPIECMLVKEETDSTYFPLAFDGITGFTYTQGYSYLLLVEKTTLANPPADASAVSYKLREIVRKIKHIEYFRIETRYGIDADRRDLIEADLRDSLPVPVSWGIGIGTLPPGVFFIDEDKHITRRAKLQTLPQGEESLPESYKLAPPEKQVIGGQKWIFTFDDTNTTIEYDVFFEKLVENLAQAWLYKDLTAYYQQAYPDAGVRGVVLVQIMIYPPSFLADTHVSKLKV
jgi:hypothetical protein